MSSTRLMTIHQPIPLTNIDAFTDWVKGAYGDAHIVMEGTDFVVYKTEKEET